MLKVLKVGSIRQGLVMWLPAVFLFIYLMMYTWQDEIFLTRLFYSLIFALVLQVVGYIAYYISLAIVGYFSGKDSEKLFEDGPASEKLIAAILLAAIVWMFWQSGINTRVQELKQCMDDNNYEAKEFNKPSDFLEWCNQTLKDQSSYDYE